MNIRNVLLPAALALGIMSSANAVPIQIDFTGIVTVANDNPGNVFGNSIAAGDTATGRFTFDEDMLNSLLVGNVTPGYLETAGYQDPSGHTNWISGAITINGQTYSSHNLSSHSDRIFVQNSLFPGLQDVIEIEDRQWENSEYPYDSYVTLRGSAGFETVNTTNLYDFIPNLLTNFSFGDFIIDNSTSTYLSYAYFGGNITSITVTRLDPAEVPEPSSLALLAVGIIGLGLGRRYTRG